MMFSLLSLKVKTLFGLKEMEGKKKRKRKEKRKEKKEEEDVNWFFLNVWLVRKYFLFF